MSRQDSENAGALSFAAGLHSLLILLLADEHCCFLMPHTHTSPLNRIRFTSATIISIVSVVPNPVESVTVFARMLNLQAPNTPGPRGTPRLSTPWRFGCGLPLCCYYCAPPSPLREHCLQAFTVEYLKPYQTGDKSRESPNFWPID